MEDADENIERKVGLLPVRFGLRLETWPRSFRLHSEQQARSLNPEQRKGRFDYSRYYQRRIKGIKSLLHVCVLCMFEGLVCRGTLLFVHVFQMYFPEQRWLEKE